MPGELATKATPALPSPTLRRSPPRQPRPPLLGQRQRLSASTGSAGTVRRLPTTQTAELSRLQRGLPRLGQDRALATSASSKKARLAFGTRCTRARRVEFAGASNTPTSRRVAGPGLGASSQRPLTTWCSPLSAITSPNPGRFSAPSLPWGRKRAAPHRAALFSFLLLPQL